MSVICLYQNLENIDIVCKCYLKVIIAVITQTIILVIQNGLCPPGQNLTILYTLID